MNSEEISLLSALEQLREFGRRLQGRTAVVFLDYDGTLTPIVSRPELARITPEMRALVGALADRCPVAIVSGRSRGKVEEFLGLENVIYAGGHGMDIAGPPESRLRLKAGREWRETMDGAHRKLAAALSGIPGAMVELNEYAVSVHYRLVNPTQIALVGAIVDRELRDFPKLRKVRGRMIWDIRPDIDWNKGRALLWIRERLGLHPGNSVAFYLGDDATDEDAFSALSEEDVGILVASRPRVTAARYSLANPSEVGRFLEGLIGILDDPSVEGRI